MSKKNIIILIIVVAVIAAALYFYMEKGADETKAAQTVAQLRQNPNIMAEIQREALRKRVTIEAQLLATAKRVNKSL